MLHNSRRLFRQALSWVIVLGWTADPNALTLHAFYKARLVKGLNTTPEGAGSPEESPSNAAGISTRYLKDGSFIQIRNITLAYALPKSALDKLKMQGVTLSLSADNVYTFTHFLGQDPATTITSDVYSTPGVSDFKYPNNRQFLFNISFRF